MVTKASLASSNFENLLNPQFHRSLSFPQIAQTNVIRDNYVIHVKLYPVPRKSTVAQENLIFGNDYRRLAGDQAKKQRAVNKYDHAFDSIYTVLTGATTPRY